MVPNTVPQQGGTSGKGYPLSVPFGSENKIFPGYGDDDDTGGGTPSDVGTGGPQFPSVGDSLQGLGGQLGSSLGHQTAALYLGSDTASHMSPASREQNSNNNKTAGGNVTYQIDQRGAWTPTPGNISTVHSIASNSPGFTTSMIPAAIH